MIDLEKSGAFIAKCRKEKNLTQKQLGERLNVTDKAVSKWERGKSFPDVSIMKTLCEELDIDISDLLAGEKISPENYKEKTENIIMASISTDQLYGFQIIIYALLLISIILLYLPFLSYTGQSFWPDFTIENIICWISSLMIAFISHYLDKKIPARKFRASHRFIEGMMGGLHFTCLMAVHILRNGGLQDLMNGPLTETFYIVLVLVICLIIAVGGRIASASISKEEWNKEKNKF